MADEIARQLLVFKSVSDKNASVAPDLWERGAYICHFALHLVAGRTVEFDRGAVSSSKLHRVRTATDVLALSIIGTAFLIFNLVGFILLNFSKTHKVTYLAWCGFRLIEKGNLEKAQKLMQRALDLNPDHSFALGVQAVLCQKLGKDKKAEEAANKALKLDKGNLLATGAKAHIMVNHGKYDEALSEADKILDAFIDHVEALSIKAEAYFGKKKWDKAIEVVDKILKKNSRIPNPHTIRAKAYRKKYEVESKENPEKAEKLRGEAWTSIREALRCDQKNIEAMVAKAIFEAGDGKIKEAKSTFLKIQALDSENKIAANGLKILSEGKEKRNFRAKHFQPKKHPKATPLKQAQVEEQTKGTRAADSKTKTDASPKGVEAEPEDGAASGFFKNWLNNSTIRRATSVFLRTPQQKT